MHANPGITHWNLGDHFDFYHGDSEFGDLNPRFTSPHVRCLDRIDKDRAYARLSTLLRLVSGIQLLTTSSSSLISAYTFNYGIQSVGWSDEDIDITIKELEFPFDDAVLENIPRRTENDKPDFTLDFVDLLVTDPLVRENILLFVLSEEQRLYYLINTYKIFENITRELKLSVNSGKVQQTEDLVPPELIEALNVLAGYGNYINSKVASGILSRHGIKFTGDTSHKPTINEIRESLIVALNFWVNFKCMIQYKRNYSWDKLASYSKKRTEDESLKDEDFTFYLS